MRRIVALFLCVCFFTFLIPVPSKATETVDSGRYILSEEIPNEIQSYAQNIFVSLSSADFEVLEITCNPTELRLSPGFKVNLISTVNYDKYYFPILKENQIVLTLIVNQINNELTYTVIQDNVTAAINELCSTKANPVHIIVSDTAVYAMDNTSTYELAKDYYATSASKSTDLQKMQVSLYSDSNLQVVNIDETSTYDNVIIQANARAVVGRSCTNFPQVNNKTVNGKGTCWASSTAAIIEYINNGSSSSASGASNTRDSLLAIQTEGGIDDAKTFISSYTGRTLTKSSSYLSWDALKTQILTLDNPCYMRLSNSTAKHATVLIGYDYDSSNNSNYNIYIMDPNVSSRYITSYSSTITMSYGTVYSWVASLFY